MQTRAFGATGAAVSRIGQGTWDIPERGAAASEAKNALRRGIDLGMTHIDTAEMYGNGGVETWLGDALAGLPRERFFVASKVLPSNATYAGTIAACERSLKRLRLDALGLFLLHWPSGEPLEETMRALEALVDSGKTRFIGVSNFDAEEMLEARGYLRSAPLACNQVLYHLLERGIEHRVVPAGREAGIAIVAYTPFGRGSFPREAARAGVLDEIARKHGVTARQVILAFLTREPDLFAIPKASRVEHVQENAGAGDITLDADDLAGIDAAFPVGDERPFASL